MSGMYRALSVFAAMALGACASEPAPVLRYAGGSESLAARKAREIEAARQHPNAQPRVRPLYPEQAPPPLPAGTTLPPPMYITRRSDPYPYYPAATESDDYAYPAYPAYSYSPRYSYGLSYGYGYPYSYGYYPSRYRYGYYGAGWGHHYGSYAGYGPSHRYHLEAPRYHISSFGASHGGFHSGGHSSHVRSVGGGFHHHH